MLQTLTVLAREDPKQPPLYMLLARIEAGLFGASPASIRALSAWLGLLALLPLFFVGRELFPERSTAWIAVGLAAVSPFQILYAQEARPYTLWMLTLFTSSALLLAALRRGSGRLWGAYGLSVTLGLFSHTLFLTVPAGRALFVLCSRGGAALGAALYAPWGVFMILQPGRVIGTSGWVIHRVGYSELFRRWICGLSSPFADLRALAEGPALLAAVCGAAIAGVSFWVVVRRAGRAGVFIAAFCLPAVVLLMGPDLLLGGGGFSTPRFAPIPGVIRGRSSITGRETHPGDSWR